MFPPAANSINISLVQNLFIWVMLFYQGCRKDFCKTLISLSLTRLFAFFPLFFFFFLSLLLSDAVVHFLLLDRRVKATLGGPTEAQANRG